MFTSRFCSSIHDVSTGLCASQTVLFPKYQGVEATSMTIVSAERVRDTEFILQIFGGPKRNVMIHVSNNIAYYYIF